MTNVRLKPREITALLKLADLEMGQKEADRVDCWRDVLAAQASLRDTRTKSNSRRSKRRKEARESMAQLASDEQSERRGLAMMEGRLEDL